MRNNIAKVPYSIKLWSWSLLWGTTLPDYLNICNTRLISAFLWKIALTKVSVESGNFHLTIYISEHTLFFMILHISTVFSLLTSRIHFHLKYWKISLDKRCFFRIRESILLDYLQRKRKKIHHKIIRLRISIHLWEI